ncbi:MAG: DUF4440 domain-containing protein [Acidobacteria bacterium]|nr:MAG: DUF4440 domain-containing protein [Acidobacteriota bacterium]
MRHLSVRERFFVSALGAIVAAGAAATTARAQDAARARPAIEAANEKFSEAVAKGDAAALAAMYTTDAEAFPPSSDVVKGRAAIEKLWKSVLDSGIAAADLVTTDVDSTGILASEAGTYAMKTKAGAVADRGKYVVTWKKVGGRWMLHRDIWNTSLPAPKP